MSGGLNIDSLQKIAMKIHEKIGIDLTLVSILSTLLVVFALAFPDGNALRVIFGLPFLLFLPGYSLVSVLWPKKAEIDVLERIALSLGLSIALVVLVGLGLNYTPWGIALVPILTSLYCLILVLVIMAWFRRSRISPEERFDLRLGYFIDPMNEMAYADKVMVIIVVITIIIAGGLLLYIAMNPPKEQFTELYIFDEDGTTENYPSVLDVNESASIIIVVKSHEQKETDYTTVITLVPESGTNITLDEYHFSLAEGKEWQQPFPFRINESGVYKLVIELFKNEEITPYTTNHLWLDVRN